VRASPSSGCPHAIGPTDYDIGPTLVNWEVSKELDSNATAATTHGRNRCIEDEQFNAGPNNVSLDVAPGSKARRVYITTKASS